MEMDHIFPLLVNRCTNPYLVLLLFALSKDNKSLKLESLNSVCALSAVTSPVNPEQSYNSVTWQLCRLMKYAYVFPFYVVNLK